MKMVMLMEVPGPLLTPVKKKRMEIKRKARKVSSSITDKPSREQFQCVSFGITIYKVGLVGIVSQ